MRIEAYTPVQQLYNTNNTNKSQKTSKTSFSDQVQISSMGKDIQTVKQAVADTPDIREDIVAPIKASIQNGTYDVSGDSFADKLLENYNNLNNL